MNGVREPLAGAAIALLLALLLAFVLIGRERPPAPPVTTMKAGAFDPALDAPDFTLAGADGSQVSLERYRGKLVLLTFGFTNCAAVCPTTLSTLAQARATLGKDADRVQVMFVTVDPERDSAARLDEYTRAFDPTFVAATGTPDALAAVREKYGVTAVKEGSGPDYAFAHTSSIFMIDAAGKLRAMMPFGHQASDFVNDIRLISGGKA